MKRNQRKRPFRRVVSVLLLAVLALTLYHIVAGYLPFRDCPALTDTADIEALADEMRRDADTCDRALLISGADHALDERLRLIHQAKREVVITSYDLRDGESTRDMLSVALERADAGVTVRLLVDGIAGLARLSPSPLFRALEDHPNIEIRFYNPPRLFEPWHDMGRMHDKYVIVDDLAYILGGRNTFDAFIGDYPVELRKDDREALVYNTAHGTDEGAASSVYALRDYFASVWDGGSCSAFTGRRENAARAREQLDGLRARAAALRTDRAALFGEWDYSTETVPTRGVWLISNPTGVYAKAPVVFSQLCALMDKAEREIILQSPYAVLNDDMAARLAGIAARTPLTVMVNAPEVSHNLVGTGDYLLHRGEVIATGVTLLEYAGDSYHHGKAMLIDEDLSVIGCYNLDLRSTFVDTELMLVIRGKDFNARMRRDMDGLRGTCRRVIDNETDEVPEGLDIPPLSPLRRAALWIIGHLVQPVRNLV